MRKKPIPDPDKGVKKASDPGSAKLVLRHSYATNLFNCHFSASAGKGVGHVSLFPEALTWLEQVKRYTAQKNVLEKLELGGGGPLQQAGLEKTPGFLNQPSGGFFFFFVFFCFF